MNSYPRNLISFPLSFLILFSASYASIAQDIYDDFEGNGNITTWTEDACLMDTAFNNLHSQGINTSTRVLRYHDQGGQYANIRFDAGRNLNINRSSVFSLKVYVPSSGLTGNQNNQIALKLQDGSIGAPWSTQCEIVKPLQLNQWQTVTFDFANDPYHNLNPNSPPPTQRSDFNRILLQLNGENNNDQVIAYIDDFYYQDTLIPPPVYNQLIWSDEFNGNGALDPNKWFHQTQLPNGGSWYNGEIQHYTNRTVNSYQSNGTLKIVAKRETFTDQGHTKNFTSARLNSKYTFTYGRVEIRAKLPSGVGTWPALWMLGKNISETGAYWQTQGFGTTSWPACGEIDIMEHWGTNQNFVQSAVHTPSSHGSTVNHGGINLPTASSQFHLYAVEWTPNELIFSVDSNTIYTYRPNAQNPNTWPFDLPQYLLFNIAIQNSISSTYTQSQMEVDFVRVYQASPVGTKEKKINSSLLLYPNPLERNQQEIFLEGKLQGSYFLELRDIKGKLLLAEYKSIHKSNLPLRLPGGLKPGIYLLSARQADQVQTFKLIKN